MSDPIVAYTYDFGDGTTLVQHGDDQGDVAVHTFGRPATYLVTVTLREWKPSAGYGLVLGTASIRVTAVGGMLTLTAGKGTASYTLGKPKKLR